MPDQAAPTDPEEAAGVPLGNAATYYARVQAYAQKFGHPPPDSHGGILKGLDPVGEGLSKVVEKGAGAIGLNDPRLVSTAQTEQDRKRSQTLYDQLLAEKAAGAGNPYQPPQVTPQNVTAVTTGPIERVSAGNVAAPQDVTLNPNARGVTAERVAAPGPLGTQVAHAGTMPGAQINDIQGQQIRQQQLGAVDLTRAAALGQAPSVADIGYQAHLADLARQQTGLALQAHGNQGVFARREAMRNISDMGQRSALDASLLKAQEMATGRGQLTGALSDIRGTDTGVAVNQAGLTQGAQLANLGEAGTTSRFNAGEGNQMARYEAGLATGVATGNADRTLAAGTTTALAQNARDIEVARVAADNAARGIGVATGNADRNLTATTTNATGANAAEAANANRLTGTAVGNADRSLTAGTTNQAAGLTANNQRINEAAGKTSAVLQANNQVIGGTGQVAAIQAGNNAAANQNDAALVNTITTAGAKALPTGGSPAAAKPDAPIDYSGGTYKPEATGGAVSDERAKKNITKDSALDVDGFLGALEEHGYQYRDPANGPGQRHGIMAQELKRSAIGRTLVHTGPDGIERVDTDGLTLALAGAVARMRREMKGRKAA